jgi:type II secretory pathway component PulC
MIPTPYIADGQLIYPGLNPALFAQAGFQPDDVLKTINGKSVTIESELEEIKQEFVNADTLVFEVMRKGRIITLYMDIPSESLTLKR